MTKACNVVGALALLSLSLAASSPVLAQAPKAQTPADAKSSNAPDDKPAAAPGAPAAATVHVTGFRSAQFGTGDAEVRAAIAKDFPGDAGTIKASSNLAERTQILTVKVADIIPDGGAADVSYVFGFKSKKLIQVNVLWSRATDPKITPERLLADGDTLRDYLLTAGYNPATITANTRVSSGVLLFRGSDADNHTTALILQGVVTAADKGGGNFVPAGLLLFYAADAANPDVFKIQPGKF